MKELIGKTRKLEPHLPGKLPESLMNRRYLVKRKWQTSSILFSQILAQSCPKIYQMRQDHLKVILKK